MTMLKGWSVAQASLQGNWKRLLSLGWMLPTRALSTNLQVKPLSKNIDLCTPKDEDGKDRPLVLLFEWLGAKKKHVLKFSEHYHGHGFDTMLVRIQPLPLLWPVRVHGVVEEIFNTLDLKETKDRELLVHAFSVGAYFLGECLVRMEHEKLDNLRRRFVGQILDSVVDVEGIPNGFSKAVSENTVIRSTLKRSLQMYFAAFPGKTMKHYRLSSKTFRSNPLNLPSLFLYSEADPIADYAAVESVMQGYTDLGLPVQSRRWTNSRHCSHMYAHPEEYKEELSQFIRTLNLR